MGSITSQITSLTIFTQAFIQAHIKENIKALRHWRYGGDFRRLNADVTSL